MPIRLVPLLLCGLSCVYIGFTNITNFDMFTVSITCACLVFDSISRSIKELK